MIRYCLPVALSLSIAAVLGSPQHALAQYRGGVYPSGSNPYNPRPTVSPYLNLLQGGATSLPQYQALVKPFLEQQTVNDRNAFDSQLLRRQVNSLQNQYSSGAAGAGRATGHPTRFMNYSHYYPLTR